MPSDIAGIIVILILGILSSSLCWCCVRLFASNCCQRPDNSVVVLAPVRIVVVITILSSKSRTHLVLELTRERERNQRVEAPTGRHVEVDVAEGWSELQQAIGGADVPRTSTKPPSSCSASVRRTSASISSLMCCLRTPCLGLPGCLTSPNTGRVSVADLVSPRSWAFSFPAHLTMSPRASRHLESELTSNRPSPSKRVGVWMAT